MELKTGVINTFKGWFFAANLESPTYWLRLDGQQGDRYLKLPLQLDVERPDVVALHPDAPRVLGFAMTIAANALPSGQYHAYLAVTSESTIYTCDSGRHIGTIRCGDPSGSFESTRTPISGDDKWNHQILE